MFKACRQYVGGKILTFEIISGTAGDSPQFRGMPERIPMGREVVVLDPAYDSYANCEIVRRGLIPVIKPAECKDRPCGYHTRRGCFVPFCHIRSTPGFRFLDSDRIIGPQTTEGKVHTTLCVGFIHPKRTNGMGIYAEYLDRLQSFEEITLERKKTLARISEIRSRDVLVIASDLSSNKAPITIDYTDLLAVREQLESLSGDSLDIILETPGGMGEVVEDVVRMLRRKYSKIGMIVPGYAKSAGTIMVMAGDEILMGDASALGPIDGQLQMADGKRFSADAFLEGLKKIGDETRMKKLNPAYIPMLKNISPGEIPKCENIQCFSKHLAAEWLAKYKFKYWDRHSDGHRVTEGEKQDRANDIANELCSQSRWLTHGRSINMDNLRDLGIKITDYGANEELNDATTRYYTLMRMSFEQSAIYKIFETTRSQIYRFLTPITHTRNKKKIKLDVSCPHCKHLIKLQANFEKDIPLDAGAVAYPVSTDVLVCPTCGEKVNLAPLREKIKETTGSNIQ